MTRPKLSLLKQPTTMVITDGMVQTAEAGTVYVTRDENIKKMHMLLLKKTRYENCVQFTLLYLNMRFIIPIQEFKILNVSGNHMKENYLHVLELTHDEQMAITRQYERLSLYSDAFELCFEKHRDNV